MSLQRTYSSTINYPTSHFILIKINRGPRIDHLMSPFVFDILKNLY